MADLEHVRWIRRPELRRPVLVVAFTGWNDAAESASGALKHLVENADTTPLAEIDPEAFTDFATIRPHVRLNDTGARQIVWPTVSLWTVSLPERDLVVMLGPEPSLRWREFCDQVLGIAREMSVKMVVTIGALLADVPHRRDVHIIGTGSDDAINDRFDLRRSQYEGPTGIVGVLGDSANRAGLSVVALWAAVPSYAGQIPSPKASATLLDRLSEIIDTVVPTAALEAAIESYEDQVDQLIASDPSLSRYVERIENSDDYDEYDDDEFDDEDEDDLLVTDDSTALPPDDRPRDDTPLPDGPVDSDALMLEVEQFLRSQRDD